MVIALRDTIKWESSRQVEPPSVDPAAPLDPALYQMRDRALAFRDLIVGAAIIEAAIHVSDVYNYSAGHPALQGPVVPTLAFTGSNTGNLNSQVRHVLNTSIPWDAARYADCDLYGRDALAYEVLARACEQAFVDNPVPRLDSTGTLIPDTNIWSLAEGAPARADINPALPLDRSLFKTPDQNLADRDNQLAGYVAQIVQRLKNPFAYALRLYVQVVTGGQLEREAEIYALISDDGVRRVYQAEPALSHANQIVYNHAHKTLQWVREFVDEIHVPQIFALEIPGIASNQFLQTISTAPNPQDCQFWRGKAAQILPNGQSVTDVSNVEFTYDGNTTGGLLQIPSASLTAPGYVACTLPFISNGTNRVNVLLKPCAIVELSGGENSDNTSGTNGGVDWPVNVSSGAVENKIYYVDGGDGILYDSKVYLPGSLMPGTASLATYAQNGPSLSTVRRSSITWNMSLPVGSWSMEIEYADLAGLNSGLGVRVDYTVAGAAPVPLMKDTVPLQTSGPAGTLQTTAPNYFAVNDAKQFALTLYWTYGEGQLHVRRLIFKTAQPASAEVVLNGTLGLSTAAATFTAQQNQTEVARFEFPPPLSGNLNGLVWAMPIQALPGGNCADPPDQITTLNGKSGKVYSLVLKIRGLVELKDYFDSAHTVNLSGSGSILPDTDNFCFKYNGTVFPDGTVLGSEYGGVDYYGLNEYALIISNPPQMYLLNNATPARETAQSLSGSPSIVNYSFAVQTAASAVVKLTARGVDRAEFSNGLNLVCGDSAPTPITVAQPYNGQFLQMDVLSVDLTDHTSLPVPFLLSADRVDIPLRIEQIDVQGIGTFAATPLSAAFQGWRQECLDRAERVVQQGYNRTLAELTQSGSVIPSFRASGGEWSVSATEQWMSFVEVANPRLREVPNVYDIVPGRQYQTVSVTVYAGTTYAPNTKFYGTEAADSVSVAVTQVGAFVKSKPGHLGRPCLVPRGLYFDSGTQSGTGVARAFWDTAYSVPTLVTCQPWMIEYGVYTAQDEFWQPEVLGSDLPMEAAYTPPEPPEPPYAPGSGMIGSGGEVVGGAGGDVIEPADF